MYCYELWLKIKINTSGANGHYDIVANESKLWEKTRPIDFEKQQSNFI